MTLTLFASAAVVMGLAALLLIATRAREDAARRLDRLQKQIKVDLATVEFQVFHHQVCAIGEPPWPMTTQGGRTAALCQPLA